MFVYKLDEINGLFGCKDDEKFHFKGELFANVSSNKEKFSIFAIRRNLTIEKLW